MPILSNYDIGVLNAAARNTNFTANFRKACMWKMLDQVLGSVVDFKERMLEAIDTATHRKQMAVMLPRTYEWNESIEVDERQIRARDVVSSTNILKEIEAGIGENIKVRFVSFTLPDGSPGFGFRAEYWPPPTVFEDLPTYIHNDMPYLD